MAGSVDYTDKFQSALAAVHAEGRYRGFDMTSVFNFVSQCPALSVPSGFTRAGLPTGLQIVGRRFADSTVLTIGAALEERMPWTGRKPPI